MHKDKIIAKLILSTGRKKRDFDLVKVHDYIMKLIDDGYEKSELANILGISRGMFNQFLSVKKISPELKKLIKERTIDSVTLVHNLAKFNHKDQINIVRALEEGKLSNNDVRALAPLRKKYSKEDLDFLINKLVNSKDIKVSVIRIPKSSLVNKIEDLIFLVNEVIGEKNLFDLVLNHDYYDIKITKKGESLLRKKAKKEGVSLTELINKFINS